MTANEASATVSDSRGKLLFYTNGVDVYNHKHQLMQNGAGIGGNISACQTLIVSLPGSDSLFYIFSTDAIENNFLNGYKFSLVDISLNNGDGAVTIKDNLLFPSCTERMAAVRHANGTDVWLITNDESSNIFRSWLITCNGISLSPVVSASGTVLNFSALLNSGMMTVSPDGKFLCQTNFPVFDEVHLQPNFFQLFDFDNQTGIISNPRNISFPDAQYNYCEFSPDSRVLYASRSSQRMIDQFKLDIPSVSGITSTRYTLSTNLPPWDIKLGPDEKIYVSHYGKSMGVINNPNTAGSNCNYQDGQVDLGDAGGTSYLGLPSHVNDIVSVNDPNNGFNFTILDSCSGSVQFQGYTNLVGPLTWQWDFGDGSTSTLQNPLHVFSPSTAVYTVYLKISSSAACGKIYRSRQIIPSGIVGRGVNFVVTKKCDSDYYRFTNTSSSLQQPGVQFKWDFGDGNTSSAVHPVHVFTSPGTYSVKLKLLTGKACLDDSLTQMVKVESFTVSTIPDQVIRVGEIVLLTASGPQGNYQWNPAVWLNNAAIKNPVATPLDDIMYKVTVTDTGGCKAADSVFIRVIQYNDIYVPNAFTPNNDGRNDIIRPFYPGTFALQQFSIFNRYGQKVFATSERNKGWDGKLNEQPQASGTYIWIISVKDKQGNVIERKGSLTLIR